jgi:hypothetical protein
LLWNLDDLDHAYDLMKDVEPLQPAEYILKGVVNAAYGQEHNSVGFHFSIKLLMLFIFSVIILKQLSLIFN